MRNFIITILLLASSFITIYAQNITGAYIAKNDNDTHLLLFVDGYVTKSVYNKDSYKNTQGGTYKVQAGKLIVQCEFDDKNPANVGASHQSPLQIKPSVIELEGVSFQKQANKSQALDGLWRITGRKVNDKIQTIQRGDRKTIKILVDGYFQWIAINPAEKGFFGTGGGKYVFNEDKYQENILFFSRDNSRVGASLNFDGKIDNKDWHHTGKSSKGDPIFEIWSRD